MLFIELKVSLTHGRKGVADGKFEWKLGSTSKKPKEQQVEFFLMLKGSLNLASINDAFAEVMQNSECSP